MKSSLIIILIFITFFETKGQIQPKKKIYNPNIEFSQKGSILIVNQKIYDMDSFEAKQILKKNTPKDSTKHIVIINDFSSKSQIKQVIFITDKIK